MENMPPSNPARMLCDLSRLRFVIGLIVIQCIRLSLESLLRLREGNGARAPPLCNTPFFSNSWCSSTMKSLKQKTRHRQS